MAYFVKDSEGNKYGPYEVDKLKELANDRRVIETTVLVDADTGKELVASSILDFNKSSVTSGLPPQMPKTNTQQFSGVPPQGNNQSHQMPPQGGFGQYSQTPPQGGFGTQQNNYSQTYPGYEGSYQQKPGSDTTMILNVISYILVFFFAPAGIITSIIAINNAKKNDESRIASQIALIINIAVVVIWLTIGLYIYNAKKRAYTYPPYAIPGGVMPGYGVPPGMPGGPDMPSGPGMPGMPGMPNGPMPPMPEPPPMP